MKKLFSAEVISYDESKDVLYKIELFDELQNEVAETRTDNERLQQIICDRDNELAESSEAISRLQNERECLKRQLEDLQSTLEFQEAKMDRAGMKFVKAGIYFSSKIDHCE